MVKAVGLPLFLSWLVSRIGVKTDLGTLIPVPVSMHIGVVLFVVSHLLAAHLPTAPGSSTAGCCTAAISLLFSGLLFMLTRRLAISQIIGFLTMENGIYLFGLSQTRGMPAIVEMGVLLDVLAAVMISGLIIFRIKQSFEHIDVSQLRELNERWHQE
jgi:hydrogenase-4 component E